MRSQSYKQAGGQSDMQTSKQRIEQMDEQDDSEREEIVRKHETEKYGGCHTNRKE